MVQQVIFSTTHIFMVKLKLFSFCLQLRNHVRASEQKIVELRHEIDSGKMTEISLEKSKSICEAQMKAFDRKYNGKMKCSHLMNVLVLKRYDDLDLAIEHREVLAQLKNMESVLRENRFEMTELKKERDEYKKQLTLFCEQHRDYQLRESIAHAKIQDAIQMIETALAEKNAALQREKEIRGIAHKNPMPQNYTFCYKCSNSR